MILFDVLQSFVKNWILQGVVPTLTIFLLTKPMKRKKVETVNESCWLKEEGFKFRFYASNNSTQCIPSWSGFHQLLNPNSNTKANVGYLQPITPPPTDMKVIFSVIDRSLDIMRELNLQQMFLEVDQAIYCKLFDPMFRMESNGNRIFDKLVPRMGGFHVIILFYGQFIRDSRTPVWWNG